MIHIRVYPSHHVHLSGMEVQEPVSYYNTVCGRKLLGYPTEDEVTCQRCIRGFERARRTYEALQERFNPQ